MYEVEIAIEDNRCLEHLVQTWKSRNLRIIKKDQDNDSGGFIYSAYSIHLENINNAKELAKRAISLNILLNGALYIQNLNLDLFCNFTGFLIENGNQSIDRSGYLGFMAEEIEAEPFRPKSEICSIFQKNPLIYGATKTQPLAAILFDKSKDDALIRDLLFHAGFIKHDNLHNKILTWNKLYKIVETIKEGCKKNGIKWDTLIDTNSLKNFTAACNNPSVLGVYSRHGASGRSMTQMQPITDIKKATSLILCFANNFIRKYAQKKTYMQISKTPFKKCTY